MSGSQDRDDLSDAGRKAAAQFHYGDGRFMIGRSMPRLRCHLPRVIFPDYKKRRYRVFMRRLSLVLLFFCTCVISCGAVQIIEFCPDPYQADDMDEYVVVSGTGSLDAIAISDNHGGFRFPSGTVINGTLTVARSAPAFEKTHGRLPDFEWGWLIPGMN
jgi:hypothetical protein